MKIMLRLFFVVTLCMGATHLAAGQCAMCKASAESHIKEGHDNVGRGLNQGIIYLMAIPYLLGATAVGVWYLHRKKNTTLRHTPPTT